MNNYSDELMKCIVKGIMSGYKNYISVRKHANETMNISNAYAYVKSNHIEDQVIEKTRNWTEYTKENAGPAWKFIKFSIGKNANNQSLYFILKNERYFDKEKVTHGKNALNKNEQNPKKYIVDLVQHNANVDFDKLRGKLGINHQLEFFNVDNDQKVSTNFSFSIITYDIDIVTKQLSSIKIWIPNPADNKAILYADLTNLIELVSRENEDYNVNDEELELLKTIDDKDNEIVDAQDIFGFELGDEEESSK